MAAGIIRLNRFCTLSLRRRTIGPTQPLRVGVSLPAFSLPPPPYTLCLSTNAQHQRGVRLAHSLLVAKWKSLSVIPSAV